MSYADDVVKARRLSILVTLYLAAGYSLPRRLLRDQVDQAGFTASGDQVAGDAAWLQEQGYVTVSGDAVTLTEAGGDVALGRAKHPGVRAPKPGEAPR